MIYNKLKYQVYGVQFFHMDNYMQDYQDVHQESDLKVLLKEIDEEKTPNIVYKEILTGLQL